MSCDINEKNSLRLQLYLHYVIKDTNVYLETLTVQVHMGDLPVYEVKSKDSSYITGV